MVGGDGIFQCFASPRSCSIPFMTAHLARDWVWLTIYGRKMCLISTQQWRPLHEWLLRPLCGIGFAERWPLHMTWLLKSGKEGGHWTLFTQARLQLTPTFILRSSPAISSILQSSLNLTLHLCPDASFFSLHCAATIVNHLPHTRINASTPPFTNLLTFYSVFFLPSYPPNLLNQCYIEMR